MMIVLKIIRIVCCVVYGNCKQSLAESYEQFLQVHYGLLLVLLWQTEPKPRCFVTSEHHRHNCVTRTISLRHIHCTNCWHGNLCTQVDLQCFHDDWLMTDNKYTWQSHHRQQPKLTAQQMFPLTTTRLAHQNGTSLPVPIPLLDQYFFSLAVTKTLCTTHHWMVNGESQKLMLNISYNCWI